MARMSREFSLVLLGAGILTTGYFLYPSEEAELEAKQNEAVQQQVAGNNNNHTRTHYGHGFIWIHTGGWGSSGTAAGGRSMAMGGNVSRGGFGSIGRASAGG